MSDATLRVILVGSVAGRSALRRSLGNGVEIVAEAPSMADVRDREAVDAIVIAVPPAEDALVERLTDREREVLELLSQGLANKAIAERLGISAETVKFHVASLSGKLGAHNRTDAVRLGVRRGLISL